MKNVPNRATGEAMPAPKPQDPRLSLSFFRRATAEEMEAGALGFIHWNVEPTGDYVADIRRGKAIAEEALSFMAANSTIINMHLISDMLLEIHRQANETHRGLVLGFGMRLAGFATVGVTVAGIDAFSRIEAKGAVTAAQADQEAGQ